MEDGSWMVRPFTNARAAPALTLLSCTPQNSLHLLVFCILFAVFHVTDQNGNKLTDESVLSYIKQVIKKNLEQFKFIQPFFNLILI